MHLAPTNFSFSLQHVTKNNNHCIKAGLTFVQNMLQWQRAQTSVTVVLLDDGLQLICILTWINASRSRLLPTQVLSEQLSPVASSHWRSASPWPGRRPSSSTPDPFCSQAQTGWTPAELKRTQTKEQKSEPQTRDGVWSEMAERARQEAGRAD